MHERWPCRINGWCGLCYVNIKGRENHKGHQGYVAPRKPRRQNVAYELRKRAGGGGPGPGVPVGGPDDLRERVPALWTFLTEGKYPDGSPRLPGSMTLFSDAGLIKAAVNDKDAQLSAFVSSGSLAGLLEAVEAGLQADSLDWRPILRGKPPRR